MSKDRNNQIIHDLQQRYGTSKEGNFLVVNTVAVPHPYCITPKHVMYAARHNGGLLSKEVLAEAEQHGAKCGICKGRLTYAKHERALLIGCKKDFKDANGTGNPELADYMLTIKSMAEADKFVGFAFKDERT